MTTKDLILLSWRSLHGNKLRTVITVSIIAFGLMALIGILTSIEAMKMKLKESFSFMGTNAFTIVPKERKIQLGGTTAKLQKKEQYKLANEKMPLISYEEASKFKQSYQVPAEVCISANTSRGVTLGYSGASTNPNVILLAGDEDYATVNAFKILHGRNIQKIEVEAGHKVCIIGLDVANKLFKRDINKAIGTKVNIETVPFTIVGIFDKKGSGAFLSFDNTVFVGVKAVHSIAAVQGYAVSAKVAEVHQMELAIAEAKGLFKSIRGLPITEEPNFAVTKSDRLASIFLNASKTITFAAIGIGIITLLGAAIGLMNIILVAVNERTKELGLAKALGSTSNQIIVQFLLESIFITFLGAVFGILIGLLIGNVVGYFLDVPFFVPWRWVMAGILLCTTTGIFAGLLPALKAGKLNPIEALRYE